MTILALTLEYLSVVVYIAVLIGIFSWIVDKVIKRIKNKRKKIEDIEDES